MNLLFLGTSSGWPIPRLGCQCSICTSQDKRDKRSRPSLLVNSSILLDAPIDIYQSFLKYKINSSKLTHIIITHSHDDHILGLYDLCHIYNLPQKITLITTAGILQQIRRRMSQSLDCFHIKELEPYKKIELGDNISSCSLIPVEHGNIEAYGIKISAPDPIFYAPEFRRISPTTIKHIGSLEILIIDGSSKNRLGQAKGHETIEEGIKLGNQIQTKKVFFTNIGHKTDTYENLQFFVRRKGGRMFNIAFDGLDLSL